MNFEQRLKYLNENSQYQSKYDWDKFRDFFKKYNLSLSTKNGFEVINSFLGCENCHVGFQFDTYLEGCTHDCTYCYAKIEGERKNLWNNPLAKPVDLTHLWNELYQFFEKDNHNSEYSNFFKNKIPLRVGALSDPFLSFEKNLKITYELINILNHYNYPYMFVTRSDLIAEDEYLNILSKKLCSVHISIPSLDEKLTKAIEPGAPSPARRLDCIKKLRENNLWTVARINPFFPPFKDGELDEASFLSKSNHDSFNFFSLELIDEIAKIHCQAVLIGFVTLKQNYIDVLSEKLNFDLSSLMKLKNKNGFFYEKSEMSKYYKYIKDYCSNKNIEFTTCYLGQKTEEYYNHQNLWSNKEDCCNNKGKVEHHKSTMLDLSKSDRKTINLNSKNPITNILISLMKFIIKKANNEKS